MQFSKQIQSLNHCSKGIIIFIVIFILAVPFVFYIGKNFKRRLEEFEKEKFLKQLNLERIKEKKSELESKLSDEFKKLEEIENSFSVPTTSAE